MSSLFYLFASWHSIHSPKALNKLQLNGRSSKIFTTIYFSLNHKLFSRIQTFLFPPSSLWWIIAFRILRLLFSSSSSSSPSWVRLSKCWKEKAIIKFADKKINLTYPRNVESNLVRNWWWSENSRSLLTEAKMSSEQHKKCKHIGKPTFPLLSDVDPIQFGGSRICGKFHDWLLWLFTSEKPIWINFSWNSHRHSDIVLYKINMCKCLHHRFDLHCLPFEIDANAFKHFIRFHPELAQFRESTNKSLEIMETDNSYDLHMATSFGNAFPLY